MESKKEIIKSLIKLVLPSVLINSILPLVLYHFFMIYFSSLNSLIIAITAPIFYNIYEVLKEKKVDAIGILMLASFAMGIEPDKETFNENTIEQLWQTNYFRFSIKFINLVWGLAMLTDATLKTILVFYTSVSVFLVVSNLVTYVVIGLTILWTIHYRNKIRHTIKNSIINDCFSLKHI